MMTDNRQDVKWSPRVPKWKLRRLYESTCTGIWDDRLIDDVGMTLYMRCRDILNIHRAKSERKVTCPRCDGRGQTSLIDSSGPRTQPFTCSVCGWSMTWRAYQRAFQRKQLNPGGAVDYFSAFVRQYEKAIRVTPKIRVIRNPRYLQSQGRVTLLFSSLTLSLSFWVKKRVTLFITRSPARLLLT